MATAMLWAGCNVDKDSKNEKSVSNASNSFGVAEVSKPAESPDSAALPHVSEKDDSLASEILKDSLDANSMTKMMMRKNTATAIMAGMIKFSGIDDLYLWFVNNIQHLACRYAVNCIFFWNYAVFCKKAIKKGPLLQLPYFVGSSVWLRRFTVWFRSSRWRERLSVSSFLLLLETWSHKSR